MDELSRTTRAVRAGIDTDAAQGAVVPPIYLSTTYNFSEFGRPREFDYSRSGNPTRRLLADALADLEGGVRGVVTATGMGAITVCAKALVPAGGRVVLPHDCYGGTWRLFDALARRGDLQVVSLDLTAPDAAAAVAASHADLVWIETPSNPLLRITDLTEVVSAARAAGALVVADNTFSSPVVQRPLEFGVDVVVHSTTKYINGHSDVVAGVIVAADTDRGDDLAWWANCLGLTGSAFDSYLTLRGLRTLHLRMRQHQESAAAIAELLASDDRVVTTHYPGLASHPENALASRQQNGFGGIVSAEITGGRAGAAAFLDSLELFSLAESLGGVESLACHPGTMTHASMPADVQAAAGIAPGLVRLSVGLEDADDLAADVRRALDAAGRA